MARHVSLGCVTLLDFFFEAHRLAVYAKLARDPPGGPPTLVQGMDRLLKAHGEAVHQLQCDFRRTELNPSKWPVLK